MCETKWCGKCEEVKPVSEFNPAGKGRAGWQSYCIPCYKAYQRAHYLKNKEIILARHAAYRGEHREEIRAWQSTYSASHRDAIAAYHAEYGERNRDELRAKSSEWGKTNRGKIREANSSRRAAAPEKFRAYAIIRNAIAKGQISAPAACAICDSIEQLEYHHEDYDKPLEVIPLCHKCHMRLHAGRLTAGDGIEGRCRFPGKP